MHHVYTDQFVVLRHKHTNQKLIIALNGIEVRKDGQYNGVNNIDDYYERIEQSYSHEIITKLERVKNELIKLKNQL